MNRHMMRAFGAAAAGIALITSGLAATSAAGAAWVGPASQATSFTTTGVLYGLAAMSASNAWAVGYIQNGKTLVLHWNGTAWKQMPSPCLAQPRPQAAASWA